MVKSRAASASFLICRSNSRLCALALEHVIETMRALPLEPLPDMPPFLLGVSIVRGLLVPVVNVAVLVDIASDARPTRWVTLRLGERQVAFAVSSVLGVRELASETFEQVPPLLREIDAAALAAITTLDAELLLVLQGARLIPEAVWHTLDAQESTQ